MKRAVIEQVSDYDRHLPDGLKVRCEKHPTYKGILPPRVQCEACEYVRAARG